MQSILIEGNTEKAQALVEQLTKEKNIDKLDILIIREEKTIGIEQIRNLQKKLLLKPIKGAEKAAIIHNCETLTIESQNALLKILEEPPINTTIIMIATNTDLLLPTIISRCKIIRIQERKNITEKELSEGLEILENIKKSGAGERLKIAQDNSKTKEQSLEFIKKIISALREKLLKEENNPDFFENLKIAQKIYTIIYSTNISPRFGLENFLLSL